MTTAATQRPPHLVVEVMSPDERWSKIQRRINHFLNGGVELVWLVDQEDRCITVYRRDSHPEVLEADEELPGDGALPDFRSRVADFFFVPGESNGGGTPPASS